MKKSGFTLLEVLVAIVILVGGVLVVANSWSGNLLRVRKANLYNNVAFLLERKITEIDAFYRGKSIDEIKEEDSGDFGADYPQYSWAMKSKKFVMPDLTSLLISKDGSAEEMFLSMIKQTTEYISKAVKEVTISVFVAAPGGKKAEFKIVTYFVDFNKDVDALGGAGAGNSTPQPQQQKQGP